MSETNTLMRLDYGAAAGRSSTTLFHLLNARPGFRQSPSESTTSGRLNNNFVSFATSLVAANTPGVRVSEIARQGLSPIR